MPGGVNRKQSRINQSGRRSVAGKRGFQLVARRLLGNAGRRVQGSVFTSNSLPSSGLGTQEEGFRVRGSGFSLYFQLVARRLLGNAGRRVQGSVFTSNSLPSSGLGTQEEGFRVRGSGFSLYFQLVPKLRLGNAQEKGKTEQIPFYAAERPDYRKGPPRDQGRFRDGQKLTSLDQPTACDESGSPTKRQVRQPRLPQPPE